MLFFSLEYHTDEPLAYSTSERQEKAIFTDAIFENTQTANRAIWRKAGMAFYVNGIKNNGFDLCAVVKHEALSSKGTLAQKLDVFMDKLKHRGRLTECKEITNKDFLRLMNQASRLGVIEDHSTECTSLGIAILTRNDYRNAETLIEKTYTQKQALQQASNILCVEAFITEIERICAPDAPTTFFGHPVHYILSAHSVAVAEKMRALLLGTLAEHGRLLSKRICVFDFTTQDDDPDYNDLDDMLSVMDGGTVVFRLSDIQTDSRYADTRYELMERMIRRIRQNRRNVLCILELDSGSEKLLTSLKEELYGITMIHLTEDVVFRKAAQGYLQRLAKAQGVSADKTLFARLGEGEKGHTPTDLEKLFTKWYDEHLCTNIYKQYTSLSANTALVRAKPKGDAYSELNAMIGLEETKRLIMEIIDFHKAQKLFADRGFAAQRPAMHMVFYGNPGTAKTTVARLIARIMKDNGLLSEGGLVEVGRGDLVGKYVGWTASLVKDLFREAKGSVLFIDEAYSLVEDREGMYGDEAINTIVQEMENARETTMVIFAGYPEKMREFVEHNPGLKSRIAFHVDFPDYTAAELMDIFRLMLEKADKEADEEAFAKVRGIIEKNSLQPDYGNGRFVRNLLEKATLRQASRLLTLDPNAITSADVRQLLPEDFVDPMPARQPQKRAIGF